jgi:type IV pilus assembly protein PilA
MRVIRSTRLLAAVLAVSAAGAPGGAAPATTPAGLPAEAFLLPQDCALVAGADVRGFFASRVWMQLTSGEVGAAAGLSPEKSAEMARDIQTNMEKGMAEMDAEFGFRADRDLDWVFFGLSDAAAPSPDGVAVLLGRFDGARILASVEATRKKQGSTVVRKQVGGTTVLATTKAGKPDFALAVPAAGHLVIGDAPLVEAVVAARAAGRRPLSLNTAMATRMRELTAARTAPGVFVLAGEALTQKMKQGGAPPPVPMPKSFSMVFEFDGSSQIAADMATAADAQQAATTLQGQLGMVSAMMAADPDPQKAAMGKWITGLAVQAEGTVLRITGAPGAMGLGTVAAIAIPSLLKARVAANESSAIGDLRTVISAQAAYQSANEGFYGEIACLSSPSTCIRGYTGPHFLDAALTSLEVKNGYRRAFHPGKRAARARSLEGYAYTAVPAAKGTSGLRSFCAEGSGIIRFDPQGGDINAVGGVCPATLQPLK